MFGLKRTGPSGPFQPFEHAVGCKIVVADPTHEPPWLEVEEGHWRRVCQCWSDDRYEPRVETRYAARPT